MYNFVSGLAFWISLQLLVRKIILSGSSELSKTKVQLKMCLFKILQATKNIQRRLLNQNRFLDYYVHVSYLHINQFPLKILGQKDTSWPNSIGNIPYPRLLFPDQPNQLIVTLLVLIDFCPD